MARKSKGRQKLEMVKMANESSLQVTFSKRRSGLFKKASELCTLCGVEVAIIVFSPGKKVYSFGHPCVESVMDRFITRIPSQTSGTMQLIEAHRNANICELNMQLTQVLNELEIENKRGQQLNQIRKDSQSQGWWQAPLDELSPTQLANLKVYLQELKKQVTQQVEKVMLQSSAPQYFHGSSNTEGNLQFDPINTGFNLSNNNMMPALLPPPPMIQSSTHPQEFSGSSSIGGILQSDPDNLGFNPRNMNMMPPPHMIQSSAPQYFVGSSSNGGILPLDPNNKNFNPSNMNMMHPPHPPPPHNQPQQPFQPLHFPSPSQYSHPGFPPGVNPRFY